MTEATLAPVVNPRPRVTPLLALRDVKGVAHRNLLWTVRTPQLLLYLLEPVFMLVLFRYILGGAIKVPGVDYVDYVVPAVFVLAVLVGAMTTAIGMAEDLQSGMIDRLRSLPMARSAVLTGRSITDLIRNAAVLAVMVGAGVAVGFRFHGDVGEIVLGMFVILAFGYAFCWMNATIGITAKDPASATNASVGPTFVLLFASNALVPVDTLPGWLQGFARNQPLSVTVSAVRSLFEGLPAAHYVWISLAWSAGLTVVFFLTSYALYQRAAVR